MRRCSPAESEYEVCLSMAMKGFPQINVSLPQRIFRLLKAECERLSQEEAYRVPYSAVIAQCLYTQLAPLHPELGNGGKERRMPVVKTMGGRN